MILDLVQTSIFHDRHLTGQKALEGVKDIFIKCGIDFDLTEFPEHRVVGPDVGGANDKA